MLSLVAAAEMAAIASQTVYNATPKLLSMFQDWAADPNRETEFQRESNAATSRFNFVYDALRLDQDPFRDWE